MFPSHLGQIHLITRIMHLCTLHLSSDPCFRRHKVVFGLRHSFQCCTHLMKKKSNIICGFMKGQKLDLLNKLYCANVFSELCLFPEGKQNLGEQNSQPICCGSFNQTSGFTWECVNCMCGKEKHLEAESTCKIFTTLNFNLKRLTQEEWDDVYAHGAQFSLITLQCLEGMFVLPTGRRSGKMSFWL